MLVGFSLLIWLLSVLSWRNTCAFPFTDTVNNGQYPPVYPRVSQCPGCPSCEGIGGHFQPWGAQCNGAFHPIGMACGFQCMCCVTDLQCPVQEICSTKLGGSCIPWEQTCQGLYKKYSADNILCGNGRCKCCINKCKPNNADKRVCEKLGGVCISSVKRCNGSTYPFCGQTNCKCCVDGSTNPRPENLYEHEDGSGPINSILCVHSGTRWCGDDLTGVCRGLCLPGEKTIRGDCEGPSCRCCRPCPECAPHLPQQQGYATATMPVSRTSSVRRVTTSPGEPDGMGPGITMAPVGLRNSLDSVRPLFLGSSMGPFDAGSTTMSPGLQAHEAGCERPGAHCGKNGTCKGQCINGEFELMEANAGCHGPECACCAEPSICPTPGTPCGNNGGTCQPLCPPGTTPSRWVTCDGRNCKCCVPSPECVDPGEPCGIGFCRPECLLGEEVTKTGSCDGSNCKCCAVPLVTGCGSPGSGCWNGICKTFCNANEIIHREAVCSGKECYCCVVFSNECDQTCGDGGTCRQTCSEREHPRVPDDCPGSACKCCVPGPELFKEQATVEEAKIMQKMGHVPLPTTASAPSILSTLSSAGGVSVSPYGMDLLTPAMSPSTPFMSTDAPAISSASPYDYGSTTPAQSYSISYDYGSTPSSSHMGFTVFKVPIALEVNAPQKSPVSGDGQPQVIYLPPITITMPEEVMSGKSDNGEKGIGHEHGFHHEDDTGHAHDVHHTAKKLCALPGTSCGKNGGLCREKQCQQGDMVDGTCYGSDCVCCVSNTAVSGSYGREKRCLSRQGKSLDPLLDGTCPACDAAGEGCGHDGRGCCREICNPREREITNLCPGIACHCCIPDVACEAPISTCGEQGAGFCAPQCQGNELDVGMCPGESCRCCVPRIGPYCDKLDSPCGEGGTCKCHCDEDEVVQPGSCTGDGCRCCVRVSACKEAGRPCGPPGSQASCKQRCTTEELTLSDCAGIDCHCCAPKACSSLGSPCGTTGVCKPACKFGEQNVGVCSGAKCMCCESIPPCSLMGAPCGSGGICKPLCNVNERIVGQCPGPMCMCCGPVPNCVAPATRCGECGLCKLQCDVMGEAVVGSCFGIDCKCCSTQPKCDGGVCKHVCGPGEENRGTCPGSTECQCCKGGCDSPGKKCRGGAFEQISLEEGSNGEGEEEEGTCKSSCGNGETEIGKCPVKACVCCSTPPADCELVSKSCGDGGLCKPLCLEDEVSDPSITCPGRACQCCIKGRCTSDDSPCGNGGRCRAGCIPGEMVTADTCPGYNCKCCCAAACESEGSQCGVPGVRGMCKRDCAFQETVSRDTRCPGRDCHCCMPPACLIPNSRCGLDGFCKPECNPGEILSTDLCAGITCKCCVIPPCAALGSPCGNGGMCKMMCNPVTEEATYASCSGRNCRCCARKMCTFPESPCGLEGFCRHTCAPDEVVASELCGGMDCKCCIRPSCLTPGSPCGAYGGGVCRDACTQQEMVDTYGHCDGKSCVCCVTRQACDNPGTSCGAFGGVCKETCILGVEEEPPTGSASCIGSNCKCCVTIPTCESYSKCCYGAHGSCAPLYIPCSGPEVPNSKCGQGCHCCAPKCSGKTCGHMGLGICQKNCEGDEDAIGECDVNMCKCCGGCIMNNKQCGSNGQGRCKMICSKFKEEEVEGDCPGASCRCCTRIQGGYGQLNQNQTGYVDQKQTGYGIQNQNQVGYVNQSQAGYVDQNQKQNHGADVDQNQAVYGNQKQDHGADIDQNQAVYDNQNQN